MTDAIFSRPLTPLEVLTAMIANTDAKAERIVREYGIDLDAIQTPLRQALCAARALSLTRLPPANPDPGVEIHGAPLPEAEASAPDVDPDLAMYGWPVV